MCTKRDAIDIYTHFFFTSSLLLLSITIK